MARAPHRERPAVGHRAGVHPHADLVAVRHRPVCRLQGAAGLRRSRWPEDHPRGPQARAHVDHLPRRDAHQPWRSRRVRHGTRRPVRLRPRRGRPPVRLDRVRPARRRGELARAALQHAATSAIDRPSFVPRTQTPDALLGAEDRAVRRRSAARVPRGRCCRTCPRWTPCRTWRACASPSASRRSASTASPTARYLGQVYATNHPDRVGHFVLDGIVDPRLWYGANLRQETGLRPQPQHLLPLGGQARARLPPRHPLARHPAAATTGCSRGSTTGRRSTGGSAPTS